MMRCMVAHSNEYEERRRLDGIIGVVRCERCGHRLDGHADCPFCAAVGGLDGMDRLPDWIFITACFLTSPFSLYAIYRTDRLGRLGKLLTFSGCLVWAGFFFLLA